MKTLLSIHLPDAWYLLLMVLFLLSLGRYLLLAGTAYRICYKSFFRQMERFRIQARSPRPEQIRHEIRYSLSTAFVFSLTGFLSLYLYRNGHTRIYMQADKYGIPYLSGSLLMLTLIHDTYFYWTHRLLHTRWFLKNVHAVHHRSTNPTPWAAYSFHPLEALIESAFIFPVILFIPVNAVILTVFLFLVVILNVMGHLGYEFYSKRFRSGWPGRILSSSTHHNLHHQVCNRNFGYYYTIWDLLMHTLYKNQTAIHFDSPEKKTP